MKKHLKNDAFIQNSFYPKKSLGQNFLKSHEVCEYIVSISGISGEDYVLEIGAGFGILTEKIARVCKALKAVEIDRTLFEHLKERFGTYSNVELINEDILKIHLEDVFNDKDYVIISNLPYSISSPFLFKLWKEGNNVKSFVIMLQLEVAKRLCAKPKTKDYGIISVLFGLTHKVEIKRIIPKTLFWPQPKVDSAIVKGTKVQSLDDDIKNTLLTILNTVFKYRRKKLKNSIGYLIQDTDVLNSIFHMCEIDPNSRAEHISPEDWLNIAKSYSLLIKTKGIKSR